MNLPALRPLPRIHLLDTTQRNDAFRIYRVRPGGCEGSPSPLLSAHDSTRMSQHIIDHKGAGSEEFRHDGKNADALHEGSHDGSYTVAAYVPRSAEEKAFVRKIDKRIVVSGGPSRDTGHSSASILTRLPAHDLAPLHAQLSRPCQHR